MTDRSALLIFDTETTGTNADYDEPCQIAAVALYYDDERDGLVAEPVLNTLCRTDVAISRGAAEVHGIWPDQLVRQPHARDATAYLRLAMDRLQERVRGDVYLSGHNIEKFDTPIVERLSPGLLEDSAGQIDTYRLGLRLFPGETMKLGHFYQLCTGSPEVDDAHDAMADCIMVAKAVIEVCKASFTAEQMPNFAMELANELATKVILPCYPYGKYRGWKLEELDSSFLHWAVNKIRHVPPEVTWAIEEACRIKGKEIPQTSWIYEHLALLEEVAHGEASA